MSSTTEFNIEQLPASSTDGASIVNALINKVETGATGTLKLVAGEIIPAYACITIQTDGKAYKGNSTTYIFGVNGSTQISSGATFYPQIGGYITNVSWAWTPGSILYVTTNGAITATVTAKTIGYAKSATTIIIVPESIPTLQEEDRYVAYDVGMTYTGKPVASAVLLRVPIPRTVIFASGLAPSQGVCGTTATAQKVFSLQKNAVEFGTMTFDIGSTTATFSTSTDTTFSVGNVLTIVAPATQDTTLADLGVILSGKKQ